MNTLTVTEQLPAGESGESAPCVTCRSTVRTIGLVVALLVFALWLVLLRPQFLGGSAGYVLVSGTSMEPALHTGDLVITTTAERYHVGDVIAYRIPRGDPAAGALVIHRIIGGNARAGYRTQGDNRHDGPDQWRPKPADVIGRSRLHVPFVGNVVGMLKTPIGLAAAAGALTILLLWTPTRRESPSPDSR